MLENPHLDYENNKLKLDKHVDRFISEIKSDANYIKYNKKSHHREVLTRIRILWSFMNRYNIPINVQVNSVFNLLVEFGYFKLNQKSKNIENNNPQRPFYTVGTKKYYKDRLYDIHYTTFRKKRVESVNFKK